MADKKMPHSILVTGGSTGIGREIAVRLKASGYQVFASVRTKEDAAAIEKLGLIAVRFDVTDDAAVRASFDSVKALVPDDHTFSLVNNAGIAIGGPLEDISIDELRKVFDVNVFGALLVTQVYLPLIRESGGRVVNMSSVSGLIVSPFLGAYAASKFALEALSDALRRELGPQGVKVLLIEPGPIKTPIWDKGLNNDGRKVSPQYDEPLAKFQSYIRKAVTTAQEPERVADAVVRALEDFDPPIRQVVTSLSNRVAHEISRAIPARWVDRVIARQLFGTKHGI